MRAAPTPIRRQLMAMMLLTSAAVLLLTCASFMAHQVITFRQEAVRSLTTLGLMIASNSTAALAFNNTEDAEAILLALRAVPQIESAALYDDRYRLFAEYRRAPDLAAPSQLAADGYRFEDTGLVGYQAVAEGAGKRLGTLYLRSDLATVYAGFKVYGVLVGLVLAGSLAVGYGLSAHFQRRISTPIVELTELAVLVSDRHDFTARARDTDAVYELHHLTRAFNQMLMRIEAQLKRLDLLQRITRAVGARQDLPNIFSVVLTALEESMPIDFGCVCLYDPVDDILSVARAGPRSTELAAAAGLSEHTRFAASPSGLERCVSGELVYEPEVLTVEAAFSRQLGGVGLHSFVAAPLLVENKVFGVMLAARQAVHAFSSGDCEFLRQLSEHVALATHQTQLYRALQQAYDDLRQSQHTVLQHERLRALGQMASGIAHDINNALSPVALYTESLLEREPTLSTRAREHLATIRRAIEDVANTVARMREFYRHREPELSLQPLDLNALAQQVIALTRPRWWDLSQQRGVMIELRTDFAVDLPTTMGAESELRDALTNLIFNAIDAMPSGGVLSVRTQLLASGCGDNQTRSVVLEVQDTGVGMDAETRQRCLEPFFTTKGERGTGLGLAMVYGMVHRHSAELEIDSEPDVGTTVRLIFGLFEPVSLASAQVHLARTTRRVRILIVDDDPLLIKSLRDILEADGHLVSAADGGQAGIDTFMRASSCHQGFALVITDLGMPYVDGRKVAESIKQSSPRTPIVMLTGWGRRMLANGEVPAYVDRMLSKPPRIHELRQAIVDLIDG